MEEKIKTYFNQVSHHHDIALRGQAMLDLFISEFAEIYKPYEGGHELHDLDKALNRFFMLKECKYVRSLLEHFVQHGNFDLPAEKMDTVHRLDRFQSIRKLLGELLLSENEKALS